MTTPADLLFVLPSGGSGSIWTGRPSRPGHPDRTDAVAVRNGRIVALDREAIDRRGPSTEVVQLAGRTLLPAFRDGHLHPLAGGAETLDGDLVDAADVAEVLARLGAFAAATPDATWVLGYGHPPELLPGGVGRAATLDASVADRPVALWSSDHHMVWCNTLALLRADITAGTTDPPRGTIVRDADGEPVGTLLEEAELLLAEHLPPRGLSKEARGLEVGLDRMVSAGLVWGQDAWTRPEAQPSYLHVADAGHLTVDLDLAFKVEVDRWREQPTDFEAARCDAGAVLRDGWRYRPRRRWTPPDSSSTCTPSVMRRSGWLWTRSRRSRRATVRAIVGPSWRTPTWCIRTTAAGSVSWVSSPTSSRCGPRTTPSCASSPNLDSVRNAAVGSTRSGRSSAAVRG